MFEVPDVLRRDEVGVVHEGLVEQTHEEVAPRLRVVEAPRDERLDLGEADGPLEVELGALLPAAGHGALGHDVAVGDEVAADLLRGADVLGVGPGVDVPGALVADLLAPAHVPLDAFVGPEANLDGGRELERVLLGVDAALVVAVLSGR